MEDRRAVPQEGQRQGRRADHRIPRECREFAEGWVDIQREEFKRLGVTGNWEDPYLTMDFHAERVIAEEFMKFLMNGTLYQGSKPVMWSPVEQTALAEAEVEYHDKDSFTIWVKFQVVGGARSGRCTGCDLDHDALDHAVEQGGRLWRGISYGLYEVTGRPRNAGRSR